MADRVFRVTHEAGAFHKWSDGVTRNFDPNTRPNGRAALRAEINAKRYAARQQAKKIDTLKWGIDLIAQHHGGRVFHTEPAPGRKSASGSGTWDESQHPRDADGKWTDK